MAVAALRAGALTGLLNQSSAQVIDGSLTFDDDKSQHLKRTFATGNRRTWTWSGWVKRTIWIYTRTYFRWRCQFY